MPNKTMVSRKQDYNNVPVAYCTTCLSLAIKDVELKTTVGSDTKRKVSYCTCCSNDSIAECHISEWEAKYEERYGKKFLDEGDR